MRLKSISGYKIPKNYKRLEKSFDLCLKDFTSDKRAFKKTNYDSNLHTLEIGTDVSPLPYMVFICLVIFKQFKYWGKGEKVAWEIPIKYKSFSFLLSHRKFGFRIEYVGKKPPQNVCLEMIKQLNKGIKIADHLVQPIAERQVELGNVNVPNRYIQINMRYRFFRQKSKTAYSRAKRYQQNNQTEIDKIFHNLNLINRAEREGFYYSIAMIDAFFSRLEHLLVLIVPFIGFDNTKDNLIQIISSPWNDKYKRIFDINKNRRAKQIYDRLFQIKEKYRNSLTHGDFEKGGASLFFHSGAIGSIPVRLSQYKDSIHYSFYVISKDSFEEICNLFDEFDNLMTNSETKYGLMFATSGLDVSFDKNSIAEYKLASESEKSMDEYIKKLSYLDMIYSNMDFPML